MPSLHTLAAQLLVGPAGKTAFLGATMLALLLALPLPILPSVGPGTPLASQQLLAAVLQPNWFSFGLALYATCTLRWLGAHPKLQHVPLCARRFGHHA